jgi:diadenosine tetraphosphate (Ap4A) HIT family hydrolase
VAELSTSTLCLSKNQVYRGQCILVFDPRHVTRLDHLSTEEWVAFMRDLNRAMKAIVSVCQPDHVNVASEGNVIPHLHWHIVPRYKGDPRWGGPITMTTMEEMPYANISSEERAALIAKLRSTLE